MERGETGADTGDGSGVWLHASNVDHSCLANASRALIGDMMIIRAVKNIRAGEEIFMSYVILTLSFGERQTKLNSYGFRCDCALCHADTKLDQTIVEKRAKVRTEISTFLAMNRQVGTTSKTARLVNRARAKKLLQEIQETYPPKLNERLPRLDCIDISLWVGQTTEPKSNAKEEDLGKLCNVLRDCGYFFTIQGKAVVIDRRNAVPTLEAAHAALYAAGALTTMGTGKENAVFAPYSLAKEVWTVRFGLDEGFSAGFSGIL